MFAQMINMVVPPGRSKELCNMLFDEYLPALRERPGFISAQLLEQIDDRNVVFLLIYWESQRSVEDEKTGVLVGSPHSIAARLPGLKVKRQSYIVEHSVGRNDKKAEGLLARLSS